MSTNHIKVGDRVTVEYRADIQRRYRGMKGTVTKIGLATGAIISVKMDPPVNVPFDVLFHVEDLKVDEPIDL